MPKLRNHNPEFCDERWRSTAASLQRLAGKLAPPSSADDLAQEALLRTLTHPPDQLDALLAYARRTLIRLWLAEERKRRRRHLLLRAFRPVAPAWRSPDEAASEREEGLRALQALGALPPLQRAAITLRLSEGLSYAAIAHALGTTPGAVRSSLHQARRNIRKALEDGESL